MKSLIRLFGVISAFFFHILLYRQAGILVIFDIYAGLQPAFCFRKNGVSTLFSLKSNQKLWKGGRKCFAPFCSRSAESYGSWRKSCCSCTAPHKSTQEERRLIPNDKLNFPLDDVWAIVIAAAAAALCAAIDVILTEENHDNIDHRA